MKWMRMLVSVGAVCAAAAAIVGKVSRDKKKQDELDEFLCGTLEEPIVQDIADDLSLQEVLSQDHEDLVLTFLFETMANAHEFQDRLESLGITSLLDLNTMTMEVDASSLDTDEKVDQLISLADEYGAKLVKATKD